jgi:hypothetical protein
MKSALHRSALLIPLFVAPTAPFFLRHGAWGLMLWLSLLLAVPAALLLRSAEWRKAWAAFKNSKSDATALPDQTVNAEVKP